MRTLRLTALVVMTVSFAGLFALTSGDIAENMSVIYIFGVTGICGCAAMTISGIIPLIGYAAKRLTARNKRQKQ